MGAPIDLTGRVFGRLVVLRLGPRQGKHRRWFCRCLCTKTALVIANSLLCGNTKSCGCLASQEASARWKLPAYRTMMSKKLSRALRGRKLHPEHIAKLRAAKLGKKHSPETKEKISRNTVKQWENPKFRRAFRRANTGRKTSKYTRQKLSDAMRGRAKTTEHNAKVGLAHRLRWQRISPPARVLQMRFMRQGFRRAIERIRESARRASLGRKHSENTKLKLSEISKGRWRDLAYAARVRAANLGRRPSPETKQKIRVALQIKNCDPLYARERLFKFQTAYEYSRTHRPE